MIRFLCDYCTDPVRNLSLTLPDGREATLEPNVWVDGPKGMDERIDICTQCLFKISKP